MSVSRIQPVAAPVMGEIAGRPVVSHYGDPAAEYAALRREAMLVDRSHRGRMRIDGPKAASMLGGLVTNDVQALQPGHGQYAAGLTPKGKIVADVQLFALDDGVLVDVPTRAVPGWAEMVRKYINPRWAPYRDVSDALRDFGVYGTRARLIVSAALSIPAPTLGALAAFAFTRTDIDGQEVLVARVPTLGVEGYELFVPTAVGDVAWSRLVDAGAVPGGMEAFEIARIEAGRPEWGLDIDETTIPQEANFDELHAISYTKGCYVGQETVARVHFRGHVNRHLRGLRFVCPDPPPPRAQLLDPTGKVVGDVRSAAVSPRLGGVAMGMVRREVELGAALTATWDGGQCRVDVSHLPFSL